MLLFFNIGFTELLVIGVVILVFFGSKGTPDVLRSLGRGLNQIRSASDELQREFKNSVNDIKKDVDLNRKPEEKEQAREEPKKEEGS